MNWPDHLPKPTSAFSVESSLHVVETIMENGTRRRRKRFSGAIETYKVSWLFKDNEFEYFKSWFEHRNKGILSFSIELPIGEGLRSVTARFNGKYTVAYKAHLNHVVTATLDTQTSVARDESWLDARDLFIQDESEGILQFDLFNNLVHVQFPTI